jgi:hypothetical protein
MCAGESELVFVYLSGCVYVRERERELVNEVGVISRKTTRSLRGKVFVCLCA